MADFDVNVGCADCDPPGTTPTPTGGTTPPCPDAAHASTGWCLGDGTPIIIVTTTTCGGVASVSGWINVTTGAFSAGAPVGAEPCNASGNEFEIGGVLCDLDANGNQLASVFIELEYDSAGAVIGSILVAVTSAGAFVRPYVVQGSLERCANSSVISHQLCDVDVNGVVTPFIRVYNPTTGATIYDRTLGGAGYTPTGTVGTCDAPTYHVNSVHWDDAGTCVEGKAWYRLDASGVVVLDSVTTLDGTVVTPTPAVLGEGSCCQVVQDDCYQLPGSNANTVISGFFQTGVDANDNPLANGANDPHWSWSTSPTGPWTTPAIRTTTHPWAAPGQNWVRRSDGNPLGVWYLRTAFNVSNPTSPLLASAFIRMRSDDANLPPTLNGTPLPLVGGFGVLTYGPLTGLVVAGANELIIPIPNSVGITAGFSDLQFDPPVHCVRYRRQVSCDGQVSWLNEDGTPIDPLDVDTCQLVLCTADDGSEDPDPIEGDALRLCSAILGRPFLRWVDSISGSTIRETEVDGVTLLPAAVTDAAECPDAPRGLLLCDVDENGNATPFIRSFDPVTGLPSGDSTLDGLAYVVAGTVGVCDLERQAEQLCVIDTATGALVRRFLRVYTLSDLLAPTAFVDILADGTPAPGLGLTEQVVDCASAERLCAGPGNLQSPVVVSTRLVPGSAEAWNLATPNPVAGFFASSTHVFASGGLGALTATGWTTEPPSVATTPPTARHTFLNLPGETIPDCATAVTLTATASLSVAVVDNPSSPTGGGSFTTTLVLVNAAGVAIGAPVSVPLGGAVGSTVTGTITLPVTAVPTASIDGARLLLITENQDGATPASLGEFARVTVSRLEVTASYSTANCPVADRAQLVTLCNTVDHEVACWSDGPTGPVSVWAEIQRWSDGTTRVRYIDATGSDVTLQGSFVPGQCDPVAAATQACAGPGNLQSPAVVSTRLVPGSAQAWDQPGANPVQTIFPGSQPVFQSGGLAALTLPGWANDPPTVATASPTAKYAIFNLPGETIPDCATGVTIAATAGLAAQIRDNTASATGSGSFSVIFALIRANGTVVGAPVASALSGAVGSTVTAGISLPATAVTAADIDGLRLIVISEVQDGAAGEFAQIFIGSLAVTASYDTSSCPAASNAQLVTLCNSVDYEQACWSDGVTGQQPVWAEIQRWSDGSVRVRYLDATGSDVTLSGNFTPGPCGQTTTLRTCLSPGSDQGSVSFEWWPASVIDWDGGIATPNPNPAQTLLGFVSQHRFAGQKALKSAGPLLPGDSWRTALPNDLAFVTGSQQSEFAIFPLPAATIPSCAEPLSQAPNLRVDWRILDNPNSVTGSGSFTIAAGVWSGNTLLGQNTQTITNAVGASGAVFLPFTYTPTAAQVAAGLQLVVAIETQDLNNEWLQADVSVVRVAGSYDTSACPVAASVPVTAICRQVSLQPICWRDGNTPSQSGWIEYSFWSDGTTSSRFIDTKGATLSRVAAVSAGPCTPDTSTCGSPWNRIGLEVGNNFPSEANTVPVRPGSAFQWRSVVLADPISAIFPWVSSPTPDRSGQAILAADPLSGWTIQGPPDQYLFTGSDSVYAYLSTDTEQVIPPCATAATLTANVAVSVLGVDNPTSPSGGGTFNVGLAIIDPLTGSTIGSATTTVSVPVVVGSATPLLLSVNTGLIAAQDIEIARRAVVALIGQVTDGVNEWARITYSNLSINAALTITECPEPPTVGLVALCNQTSWVAGCWTYSAAATSIPAFAEITSWSDGSRRFRYYDGAGSELTPGTVGAQLFGSGSFSPGACRPALECQRPSDYQGAVLLPIRSGSTTRDDATASSYVVTQLGLPVPTLTYAEDEALDAHHTANGWIAGPPEGATVGVPAFEYVFFDLPGELIPDCATFGSALTGIQVDLTGNWAIIDNPANPPGAGTFAFVLQMFDGVTPLGPPTILAASGAVGSTGTFTPSGFLGTGITAANKANIRLGVFVQTQDATGGSEWLRVEITDLRMSFLYDTRGCPDRDPVPEVSICTQIDNQLSCWDDGISGPQQVWTRIQSFSDGLRRVTHFDAAGSEITTGTVTPGPCPTAGLPALVECDQQCDRIIDSTGSTISTTAQFNSVIVPSGPTTYSITFSEGVDFGLVTTDGVTHDGVATACLASINPGDNERILVLTVEVLDTTSGLFVGPYTFEIPRWAVTPFGPTGGPTAQWNFNTLAEHPDGCTSVDKLAADFPFAVANIFGPQVIRVLEARCDTVIKAEVVEALPVTIVCGPTAVDCDRCDVIYGEWTPNPTPAATIQLQVTPAGPPGIFVLTFLEPSPQTGIIQDPLTGQPGLVPNCLGGISGPLSRASIVTLEFNVVNQILNLVTPGSLTIPAWMIQGTSFGPYFVAINTNIPNPFSGCSFERSVADVQANVEWLLSQQTAAYPVLELSVSRLRCDEVVTESRRAQLVTSCDRTADLVQCETPIPGSCALSLGTVLPLTTAGGNTTVTVERIPFANPTSPMPHEFVVTLEFANPTDASNPAWSGVFPDDPDYVWQLDLSANVGVAFNQILFPRAQLAAPPVVTPNTTTVVFRWHPGWAVTGHPASNGLGFDQCADYKRSIAELTYESLNEWIATVSGYGPGAANIATYAYQIGSSTPGIINWAVNELLSITETAEIKTAQLVALCGGPSVIDQSCEVSPPTCYRSIDFTASGIPTPTVSYVIVPTTGGRQYTIDFPLSPVSAAEFAAGLDRGDSWVYFRVEYPIPGPSTQEVEVRWPSDWVTNVILAGTTVTFTVTHPTSALDAECDPLRAEDWAITTAAQATFDAAILLPLVTARFDFGHYRTAPGTYEPMRAQLVAACEPLPVHVVQNAPIKVFNRHKLLAPGDIYVTPARFKSLHVSVPVASSVAINTVLDGSIVYPPGEWSWEVGPGEEGDPISVTNIGSVPVLVLAQNY